MNGSFTSCTDDLNLALDFSDTLNSIMSPPLQFRVAFLRQDVDRLRGERLFSISSIKIGRRPIALRTEFAHSKAVRPREKDIGEAWHLAIFCFLLGQRKAVSTVRKGDRNHSLGGEFGIAILS